MPVLRKESEIFPADLFEMPTRKAPWEIGHLRSRQEKAVARLLLEAGLPFYLPQIQQKKTASGRTHVCHLPLFPGYIFLRGVDGMRETLSRTDALATVLDVPDQAQLTAELQQIRQLQASGAELTLRDELVPGDTVLFQDGAFKGYSGVVVEDRGTLRLIVSVSALRKSLAVEFPREHLARQKPDQVARDRRRV